MGKWVRIYSLAIVSLKVLVQNGCWATCFALLMDRSCRWLDIGANVPERNNKWRCFRYHNWCRNLVCPSTTCDVRFFENDPADAELSNKFGCIITGISTVRWQNRVYLIFALSRMAIFTHRKFDELLHRGRCTVRLHVCMCIYTPEPSQHFYHSINVGVETVSKSQVTSFFSSRDFPIIHLQSYKHLNKFIYTE